MTRSRFMFVFFNNNVDAFLSLFFNREHGNKKSNLIVSCYLYFYKGARIIYYVFVYFFSFANSKKRNYIVYLYGEELF